MPLQQQHRRRRAGSAGEGTVHAVPGVRRSWMKAGETPVFEFVGGRVVVLRIYWESRFGRGGENDREDWTNLSESDATIGGRGRLYS